MVKKPGTHASRGQPQGYCVQRGEENNTESNLAKVKGSQILKRKKGIASPKENLVQPVERRGSVRREEGKKILGSHRRRRNGASKGKERETGKHHTSDIDREN